MQGPAFLPQDLIHYETYSNDKELFKALIAKPAEMVDFFELACADQTWSEEHFLLIRSLIRWGAKSYFLGHFPPHLAKRMAAIIQTFFNNLKVFLYFRPSFFLTATFYIEKTAYLVNTLLFGVSSPFFHNILKNLCFNKLKDEWFLTHVSQPIFELVQEFVLKGEIGDLWKHEPEEILKLMKQAKYWDLPSLVKECAVVLKRYINRENVIDQFLQAHKEFFGEWKSECISFFNNLDLGLRIHVGKEADIKIEILNFYQETIELFDRFALWTTHLIFHGSNSESPFYDTIVHKCPKLIGLALINSFHYSKQFDSLPKDLLEMELIACPWLNARILRDISNRFSEITFLNLGSNPQLNYMSWSELNRFSHLNVLNLSQSYQITDEDLKMIIQAASNLIELNLEGCKEVSDRGVVEIVHLCKKLQVFHLNFCNALTDRSLLEIGTYSQISTLSIMKCSGLTDRGLISLVQTCRSLRYLNVKDNNFSISLINEIKKKFFLIELIF